jgi:putative hemolysin
VSPLIWVVLVATALSGFFALAGTSLRSPRRTYLEEAFSGNAGARRLALLDAHIQDLRLTMSFCRAVANLVLVIALAWIFDATFSFWHSVAAVGVAGAVIAVVGVAIPHAWAAHGGEKILSATLWVLMSFRYALWPITFVMKAFDVPIRRLSGVSDDSEEDGEAAKQEIIHAATDGQAEGAVDLEEVQMIESVIEFGDTHAGEIMTPRTDIFALPIDTPWQQAVEQIVEAGHTRVPVYEGDMDHIVGLLYAKDMLKCAGTDRGGDIRGILRKCYFVPETKPLDQLLKEFKIRKVHLAIVLDEYGGTAGLVSIEDLLEEIVGDIADEYDVSTPAAMKRLDERSAEIDGRMYVDELNDAMDLELPEDEDYDTVAGFVFSELGYVPDKGQTLESHGARFTVLAADERKIIRLRVDVLRNGAEKG